MRSTSRRLCANLRTLGLDASRQHTAAEIKAAYLERAKSTHPDAGGDAARFRQLKEAYDALRGTGDAARPPSYHDVRQDAANGSTSAAADASRRSHIYAERYNDGDATPRPEKHTWDYGSGTRYANNSTRSFYRPYASNVYDPSATGFTRDEVARAEMAMRLHLLRRILWNLLIYGSALYLLFEFLPPRRPVDATDYQIGLDEPERRRRAHELRQMQPELQEEWSDKRKARYLEEWNNRIRDREHVVSTGRSEPFSEAAAVQMAWDTPSMTSASPVEKHTDAAPMVVTASFSSPHTYCDMADEDVDVE